MAAARVMRRIALLAAGVLAGAVLLGGAANAHANYLRSNPDSDARLARPPTEVRIEFSEPPDPRGSEILVLDPTGKRYDLGDIGPSGDPNGLRVSVGTLGEGGYTVAWTALSAVDGHTTKGSFVFVIGSGPLPAPPDVGAAAPPPTPLEIAGRALSYTGIALGLGTAFFVAFVARFESRREAGLLALAGALIAAGSLALALELGTSLPPRLGALLGVRALAGLLLVTVSVGPELARMRPVAALASGAGVLTIGPLATFGPRRMIALSAALAAAMTATLVSHAAADPGPRNLALDFIHVVAASVWSGGVVALLRLVLLRSEDRSAEDARSLGVTVWRFSITALGCVALIVVTGVLQSLDRLVLVQDLYETPYGIALAVKITLLAAALGLGALNLFRFGPRLRAGLRARHGLVRDTLGETALFVVILIAASFLTALAPPAQATAAAYDETHHIAGLRLQMLVASGEPGRNRYVLRVQRGLAPIAGAEKVLFRFTMVEHDMGEQELVAAERAPGEYVADGSPTGMFGTWRIQAIVRLVGREDISTVFSFPVSAGGSAQSKVVTAGPYTMIAFTDPATPEAGAPVAIFVVLVGQDGNPVIGKTLRATFAGPSPQAPLGSVEDPATLGPGRYRFDVAALDAGRWDVTIAIGDEGSGTYSLEVSR